MQAKKSAPTPASGGATPAGPAPAAGHKGLKAGLKGATYAEGAALLAPGGKQRPTFAERFVDGRCDACEAWIAAPNAKVTGVVLDVEGLGWDPTFGKASFGEGMWDRAHEGRKMVFAGTYIGDVEATDDLGQAGANPLWVRAKGIQHNYRYAKDPETGKQRVIDDDQRVFLLGPQNNLIVEADAWLASGFLGGPTVIAYTGEDEQEGRRPAAVEEQQERHFKSKTP